MNRHEIIAALIASGLTAEQLGLLLQLVSILSSGQSTDVHGQSTDKDWQRKERDKLRQRENRAKLRASRLAAKANDIAAVSSIVHGQSTGQVDTPCNLLTSLSESSLAVSKKDIPTSVVEGRKRGTRLEQGALLNTEFLNAALELGATMDGAVGMWAEFVDYWCAVPGSRGLKTNWLATWRNRVRDVLGRRKGQGNGKPTVHDAAKELSRRLSELDEPAPGGGLFEQAGGGVVRLIPSR